MSSPSNSSENISVTEARKVEPKVVEPDKLALLEQENAHKHSLLLVGQGWVGKFLGSNENKPGNIAAIVILFCFIMIAGSAIWAKEIFGDIFSGFTSIITLVLGYLFGSKKD